MKTCGIVVAAGTGERMGSDKPKALVQLAGKPIVEYSVRAMAETDLFSHIVVAAPRGYESEILDVLGAIQVDITITTGGDTRSDSVRTCLRKIIPDCEIVAIHDGARPLITKDYITRVVESASEYGAAVLATSVTDTLKEAEEGFITRTISRKKLWAVQTPQVFERKIIERAYQKAPADLTFTDDCALVERIGIPIKIVRGSRTNIKITFPEDIAIASAILENR